jgi:CBS domain-containing protein
MNAAAILKLKGLAGRHDRLGHVAARHRPAAQQAWHCVVVAQEDGKAMGIVSERDMGIASSGARVLNEPVEVCMTKTVVTAREADTIDRLVAEMTTHRFRHTPVVERKRLRAARP